jgi:glyoxylase-like metal-dependent hydrolase (beta-lactamase superfamily II)
MDTKAMDRSASASPSTPLPHGEKGEVREIARRVFKIELPIPFPIRTSNVYFIDERPRTLIDTGIKTESSFEALKSGMEDLGFSLRSIERILITHGHIDHYGQAHRIAALSGAPVYIHPVEYGRIRSFIHSLGMLKILLMKNGAPEVLVGEAIHFIESAQKMADSLEEAFFLEDKETIPFESMSWQAVLCPGHSPGLLCFYWKEEKILFTGDHLLKKITPNPVLNIPEDGSTPKYTSLKQYIASLEKIERMEIALAFPGHGEMINDPTGLIKGIFKHHQERTNLIHSLLSIGRKTPYEIAMALFPGIPPFDVFLGISEVLGHLEILKEKGKVRCEEAGGKDFYLLEG